MISRWLDTKYHLFQKKEKKKTIKKFTTIFDLTVNGASFELNANHYGTNLIY